MSGNARGSGDVFLWRSWGKDAIFGAGRHKNGLGCEIHHLSNDVTRGFTRNQSVEVRIQLCLAHEVVATAKETVSRRHLLVGNLVSLQADCSYVHGWYRHIFLKRDRGGDFSHPSSRLAGGGGVNRDLMGHETDAIFGVKLVDVVGF